jgi:hypothetical protein
MGKDEGTPVPSTLSSTSAESIELLIEDQAFLRSYDLAPPLSPPNSPFSKLSLFLSLLVCRRPSLQMGDVGGGGAGGAKSYDCEKARSSMNKSILSEMAYVRMLNDDI